MTEEHHFVSGFILPTFHVSVHAVSFLPTADALRLRLASKANAELVASDEASTLLLERYHPLPEHGHNPIAIDATQKPDAPKVLMQPLDPCLTLFRRFVLLAHNVSLPLHVLGAPPGKPLVSNYGGGYYCHVEAVVVHASGALSLAIHEHGDMLWGSIQSPLGSTCAPPMEMDRYRTSTPRHAFSVYDLNYNVVGILTYPLDNDPLVSQPQRDFSYGYSGYGRVTVLDLRNPNIWAFQYLKCRLADPPLPAKTKSVKREPMVQGVNAKHKSEGEKPISQQEDTSEEHHFVAGFILPTFHVSVHAVSFLPTADALRLRLASKANAELVASDEATTLLLERYHPLPEHGHDNGASTKHILSSPVPTTMSPFDRLVMLAHNVAIPPSMLGAPVSRYNGNYYCNIEGVVVHALGGISLAINEHGNMSLGGLQPAESSVLSRNDQPSKRPKPDKFSFSVLNRNFHIVGVLRYNCGHVGKEATQFNFTYGYSGYDSPTVLNTGDPQIRCFLEGRLADA